MRMCVYACITVMMSPSSYDVLCGRLNPADKYSFEKSILEKLTGEVGRWRKWWTYAVEAWCER